MSLRGSALQRPWPVPRRGTISLLAWRSPGPINEIDKLANELYGLTDEEIKIVEGE